MLHQVTLTPTQLAAKNTRIKLASAPVWTGSKEPKFLPASAFLSSSKDVGGTYYAKEPPQRTDDDGGRAARKYPMLAEIRDVVCKHFNIGLTEFESARRSWNLVRPRMVFYVLAKKMTLQSYPQIAKLVGGRDHTTILSGCNRVEVLIENGDNIGHVIDVLRRKIEFQLMAHNSAHRRGYEILGA